MKVQHVVLFRTAKELSAERIDYVGELFLQCLGHCDGLENIQWVSNQSASKFASGWTCGTIMQFRDAAARDNYLIHPMHQEVSKETSKGFYTQVVVFDYDDPGEKSAGRQNTA